MTSIYNKIKGAGKYHSLLLLLVNHREFVFMQLVVEHVTFVMYQIVNKVESVQITGLTK